MTTIPTGLSIKSAVSGERTSPQGFRLAMAGLLVQTAPGVVAGGRLYAPSDVNGEPLAVAGHATLMKYTINKGVVAIPRTGQGVYIVANPTFLTIDTASAHATLARVDRVFIAQPDPELSDTGVARVDVVNGVADNALPVPALPAGGYELARKVIAAGATNTVDGAAFTNIAPITQVNALPADASVTTAKLADASVTNAKLAASGLSASKITIGILPTTVETQGNHTGKIKGADYYLQVADPTIAGSVADGSLWDSWTP